MAYEISIGDRTAKVNILNRAENKAIIEVDDRKYELDIAMVENGVYSILWNGRSFNLELIPGETAKSYMVNTWARTYEVEIIDAETKYRQNRNSGMETDGDSGISSPMPGKVVKIPVSKGEKVTAGQTLIVIEAMKMQSEFKAKSDRIVTDILVKEGDTVNAHQLMLKLD